MYVDGGDELYVLLAGVPSLECRRTVVQGVVSMSFHCVLFSISIFTPVFIHLFRIVSFDRLGNCRSSI